MSAAIDVLDILDFGETSPKKCVLDKEALLSRTDKRKNSRPNPQPKRPDHVPREVWGLQSTLNINDLPPIMPADNTPLYKQPKAVIGVGKVGPWHWTPFTNSARQDNLVLYHWRRGGSESESNSDYYFARYNKHVTVPEYTPEEYETMLKDSKWSEERTAHLMELAKRFDLRFIHMRDRWDCEQFPGRPSIEDLKERYYGILTQLDKARGTNLSQGLRYDAVHERRRKQQLSLLYGRSKDQVEEEQRLLMELRKIETRRKERERKKQDLQKLISLADSITRDSEIPEHMPTGLEANNPEETNSWLSSTTLGSSASMTNTPNSSGGGGGAQRKRIVGIGDVSSNALTSLGGALLLLLAVHLVPNTALNTQYTINFLELGKNPGVHLRSQKMKLPSNLGQKKTRIIENFLGHLQIDPNPPATAEIVEAYNSLRSKILLLFDLRLALLNCDFELHSARLRLEAFAPNQPLPLELASLPNPGMSESSSSAEDSYYNIIDPLILAALRVADSKRPILPRHSLGVAGTLAAAAGSLGLYNAINNNNNNTTNINTTTSDLKLRITNNSLQGSTDFGHISSDSIMSANRSSPALSSSSSAAIGIGGGNFDSDNSSSAGDGIGGGSSQRRRRAAALEQGRVLKKLKIKGQLVDYNMIWLVRHKVLIDM
ncbi:unnamed protein product [Trichobilharzia szidati]|nr:unnamed protein product [Trichobilharzia szidati]